MSVVEGFVFGGREVVQSRVQSGVVVPVDPFHQGVFDIADGLERSVPTHDLGLEQTDDRFGERVVVGLSG